MSREQLDATGMKCPLPVLKARKRVKSLDVDTELEVLATDPGAPKDFEAFCESQGHRFVSSEEDGDGVFHIRLIVGA